MKPPLLLVDDDEAIRTQMKWSLAQDYDVTLAGDRAEALQIARAQAPDVILLDLGLPPHPSDAQEGFLALGELLALRSHAKVIVITGQSDRENALQAVGQGAYDFLNKPVDLDELRVMLKRAFYVARLEREYREAQARLAAGGFEGMLGDSPQIQAVFAALRKVATVDASVLLLGESGTGKEMAALAIHRHSVRKAGPFVAINCHAIPETLLESELFGHEKGAFTGAHQQRAGRIEMASGGTLLLDEIGELTPSLQVKLLRFLQDQSFERVGGRTSLRANTRVIAATNADLQKAMADGRFREDLYFRIAVVTIRIPPLRERAGDIPLLARAFLRKYGGEAGKELAFSAKAAQALSAYEWPGNVRELENRVRRAVVMADGRLIKPTDLELDVQAGALGALTLKDARDQLERDMVRRALTRSKGNISKAAEALGVSRPTLYEMMDKLGVARPE
jgi:two-component system NtrC family response regulator